MDGELLCAAVRLPYPWIIRIIAEYSGDVPARACLRQRCASSGQKVAITLLPLIVKEGQKGVDIMTKHTLLLAVTVCALCSTARADGWQRPPVSFSPASHTEWSSYVSRLESLESEIAALNSTSAATFAETDRGWWSETYVGAEIALLRPHVGTIAADYDIVASPGLWFGREDSDGRGWRVTGWYLDSSLDIDIGGGTVTNTVESYSVDLDLTQRCSFCGWDLSVFGGVRIGGLATSFFVTAGADTLLAQYQFDSVGMTIGMGFERPIGRTRFSIFGNYRVSFLYGTASFGVTNTFVAPFTGSVDIVDQMLHVQDIDLGLEYRQETGLGTLFARAAVEGKVWEVPPILLGIGDANVGFFGPTFSAGLIW